MTKLPFTAPSSDGIHTLRGVVYVPAGTPVGFFHAVHGMTEHIARYDRILTDLAARGYISFGYDHLGHGHTVNDASELGYIAPRDGYDLLCRDVKIFSDAVRDIYDPNRVLPYHLMGHSMGSFITRLAIEAYVKPDHCIIMGTGDSGPAADVGLFLINTVKLFHGDRYISPLLDKIAFGSYNSRFGGGSEDDPSPWLTPNEEVRRKYYADPLCTFKFTVSAMGDLIRSTKYANRADWYKNIPHTLPILLLSGEEDPVGNFGRGVRKVEAKLQKAGCPVTCILYPGARHEILNDVTYEQVRDDILAFLQA